MTTHSGERLVPRTGAHTHQTPTTGLSVSLARPTVLGEVLDAVTVGVVVHDEQGNIVAANEMARSLLAGLPAAVLDNAVAAVAGADPARPRSFTLSTARPDGTPRQVVATSVPHAASGTVVTTLRDLHTDHASIAPDAPRPDQPRSDQARGEAQTADPRLQETLAIAHRRLHTALERSPIGTAVLTTHGRIIEGNKVLARLLGRPAGELTGLSLAEVTHPEDGARESRLYDKLLHRSIDGYELEKRLVRHDGRIVWVRQSLAPVPDEDGRPAQFILQVQDLTETRTAVARLTHQARHDPLTGLANRIQLAEAVHAGLDRSRRSGAPCAVLSCDLDGFRVINDGLGPGAGDAVLITVARRIAALLDPGDTLARLDGDEFVVVRPQVADRAEVSALAERLVATVGEPVEVGGRTVLPGASVGVALSGDGDTEAVLLLRDASTALHRAKSAGGGWQIADESMRRAARERIDLEEQLRTAVREGQLRLFLQPIVALRDQRIVGREALIRWQHPEHGLLPPARFLPVAEQAGLIDDVGRWVISAAARLAAATPHLGYMAINVSPSQVRRTDLAGDVRAALTAAGLPPSRLVIELTESVVLDGSPPARDQLTRLNAMGVPLVVDDFGTGFSALSHLRDLPVSGIKIDRSFTQGLGQDRHCERIVEALIGLARGLDVDLVAEGVETEQQAATLAAMGCPHAQGFLFGRPEPAHS